MSYDLYFWREIAPHSDAPDDLCNQLCEDIEPDGVAFLSVAQIRERFATAFPDIEDCGTELNWEGAGSYFQVGWPISSKPGKTLAISVGCGYQLLKSPETMNRIIAVGNELGCALYDPQTGERYLQPDPTI